MVLADKIEHLQNVTGAARHDYLRHAYALKTVWEAWKAQHDGNMNVLVEFFGERGRGGRPRFRAVRVQAQTCTL